VKGIVQSWYPGQAGGQAIAEMLTGAVNPSGHFPITFPANLGQTPCSELLGQGTPWPMPDRFTEGTPVTIEYKEGAEVGYRWFATKTGERPLYAFGHGLSYTSFEYGDLEVSFTVKNTGDRAGADVPQFYPTEAAGESKRVEITTDPRSREERIAWCWASQPTI
jgi:beta-glucosidase